MGFHQRWESGPGLRWKVRPRSKMAMKLQTCKPVEARRRLFAALLLGLWVACGVFCADRAPGCDRVADSSAAGDACCRQHGNAANLPEDEGQSAANSGAACCDSVTKPAVEVLQLSTAAASLSSLEPGDVIAVIVAIDPASYTPSSALPEGRASRTPPIQLLGVSHLPHGPPAHA